MDIINRQPIYDAVLSYIRIPGNEGIKMGEVFLTVILNNVFSNFFHSFSNFELCYFGIQGRNALTKAQKILLLNWMFKLLLDNCISETRETDYDYQGNRTAGTKHLSETQKVLWTNS